MKKKDLNESFTLRARNTLAEAAVVMNINMIIHLKAPFV